MWSRTKDARTTVPLPFSDSITKVPPAISAAILKSGMPSPTLRVVRVVVNGSVTLFRNSASIPQPSSAISIVSVPPSAHTVTRTSDAPALTEFSAMSSMFSASSLIPSRLRGAACL